MKLAHLHPIIPQCSLKLSTFSTVSLTSHSFVPPFTKKINSFTISAGPKPIPARDRVIDFGKFKGKMLGTIPSKYLKWVSNNLRAQDFKEWAILADEVLVDPVYKDRIEWEFAQNLLEGEPSSTRGKDSAVPDLIEISTRFGWDNDDKLGWKKINFEFLGTSKGGRIPRLGNKKESVGVVVEKKKKKSCVVENENDSSIERRRERRMRLMKRMNGSNGENLRSSGDIDCNDGGGSEGKEQFVSETKSRFPGREGLLKKVLSSRGSWKQS